MSKDKNSAVEFVYNERERSTFHHNKTVVDQIKAMYESGESVLKISQLFGVTSNYVHVTAKRKGWQRPSWYQWKFRTKKKDDQSEEKSETQNSSTGTNTVIAYRTDPTLLALFDKYADEIREQKARIISLEAMCNSFNRLSMIQEVYEQLDVDDKQSLYEETFSSVRSENIALREINESLAKENNALKEQAQLLNEKLKECLKHEGELCDKLAEAVESNSTAQEDKARANHKNS